MKCAFIAKSGQCPAAAARGNLCHGHSRDLCANPTCGNRVARMCGADGCFVSLCQSCVHVSELTGRGHVSAKEANPWMTPGEFAKTIADAQRRLEAEMPGASVSSEAPLSKMLKRFEAAVERIDAQFSRFEKLIGFESSAEKASNRLTLENEKLKAERQRLLACIDRLDDENRDLKVEAAEHGLQAKKREAELEKLTREVKSWRAADSVRQQIESMEVSRLSKELLAEVDADMRRYASQLVDKAIFGPRAAPPRVCQFQLKRVYQLPVVTPLYCTNEATVGPFCQAHSAEKCVGCKRQAVRICPSMGCLEMLCDNCTHIVSGAHAPKPKGAEPVLCNFGIDGPITRRCYKTALEASIYCADHQAERCAFGKGTPLRHCWDSVVPGFIYCKDHQPNIEGGALPPGVQSATAQLFPMAEKSERIVVGPLDTYVGIGAPTKDEDEATPDPAPEKPKQAEGVYAITFTITPKQGLVIVEKKP